MDGVSARDARRRRIMERGSDRLAFITGEARTLPDPPLSPLPPRTTKLQEVASFSQGDASAENDDGIESIELPLDADADEDEDEGTEEFPKCKLGKEFPKRGKSSEAATDAHTTDGSTELSNTSAARESSDRVPDAAPSTAPLMSHQIFTADQISRSVAATENIRILCATAIALLVVLSYHGYSLGGSIVGGLVSFRPLFLVLLTDVTIVLGRVLVMEGSDDRNEDEGRRTRQEEKGMADNVGNALEAGLVLQKALRAAFMDCSICAVIMISGLVV